MLEKVPIYGGEVLRRGAYRAARVGDSRSPCPMLNSLANRGYLPRDGKDLQYDDFMNALETLSLSSPLRKLITGPIFLEHFDEPPKRSFLSNIWYYISNPWAIVASDIGVRQPGRVDLNGKPVIDLNDLALHNAVEHDVSLTRRDAAQGDNHTPQQDLIEAMLATSTDSQFVTMDNLTDFMKQRIATQQRDNKQLDFTPKAHQIGAGEIAFILKVLGDGEKVRCDYLRAFYAEERLPVEEGWTARTGSSLGLIEFQRHTERVKGLLGYKA